MNQAERKYPTRSDKRRRGNSTRPLGERWRGEKQKRAGKCDKSFQAGFEVDKLYDDKNEIIFSIFRCTP
jgi:hypothetical protein